MVFSCKMHSNNLYLELGSRMTQRRSVWSRGALWKWKSSGSMGRRAPGANCTVTGFIRAWRGLTSRSSTATHSRAWCLPDPLHWNNLLLEHQGHKPNYQDICSFYNFSVVITSELSAAVLLTVNVFIRGKKGMHIACRYLHKWHL